MVPEELINAWLLAVQIAAEREAQKKPYAHIEKHAQELRDLIDNWPPPVDPRDHARKGILDFTDRQK